MHIRKSSSPESLQRIFSFAGILSATALLLFLNGCSSVGPTYETPESPVPQEYEWIDIDAPRVNDDSADLSRWWTVFNDPLLDSLVEQAYQQNLTLRVAGLRILEARANLGIAEGSKWPQTQQINAGAARINPSERQPDAVLFDESFRVADATFDVGWELDFWGRFRDMTRMETARLEASIANYDDVMVTLAAEVARSYVFVRTIEQRLTLAKTNIDTQRDALQIADVRFQNGAVTELDVQQARAVLSRTQSIIPLLEPKLRQSKNALAVLLGLTPREVDALLTTEAPIPVAPQEVSMGVPAEMLRRRPDVRQAERRLAAQSASIGVAITDLYPRFSLAGSVGFRTSDLNADNSMGNLFDSSNVTGFLGPFFSWNVLNYGRIKNNIRVQDARFQQLLVGYQSTVLSALAETENAIIAYQKANDQAAFLGESVDAAQRSVNLSLIQYREGTTDFNRVITTLNFLFEQQDEYSATVGDAATNLISMYKALGGGYQPGSERDIADFVTDEDREDLRSRTKYWNKQLPEN